MQLSGRSSSGLGRAGQLLRRPEVLAFLPALSLLAYWLGGERTLVFVALGLPLFYATVGAFRPAAPSVTPDGLALRPQVIASLDRVLQDREGTGRTTACLVLQFDGMDKLLDRHGRAAQSEVLARCCDRLCGALREGDTVARLEGGGLAVALHPVRRLDLQSVVLLAGRLQTAIAAPISVEGTRIHVTCSIGFCLAERTPAPTGRALLDAAQVAADEASRNGPGAVRAYALGMSRNRADRDAYRGLLETALDTGQFTGWFQPQIRTEDGAIGGFEVLSRWQHPERGLLLPQDFLPAIERAGLSERLGEVMLFQALTALRHWDRAGLCVPCVAVNFSATDLRNPRLVDRLKWELDRFELTPARLSVEILETVVAEGASDVVVHNIAGLSAFGFGVDLDDFGTGHASITTIRRFALRRLKIDRSFVTRADSDAAQRTMLAAIISMARQLGLETLAEGVETPGELATLTALGCGYLQGYAIARPMALSDATAWLENRRARLPPAARCATPGS
ncbi:putative bifunctional diguanylate cyclase/phosphodiesterase [Cereibacter sphaeroides]|uniref:putative bifunctional diguanylate cyclase/phosphodiesterase n=1 Tax=Cereibacter sphaeroides TaxID=1063 RepID=UPI003FCD558D